MHLNKVSFDVKYEAEDFGLTFVFLPIILGVGHSFPIHTHVCALLTGITFGLDQT